ncbi:hypothetical protein [Tateyamaria sp. syn59]|uniref:hypothetical protein n=1 Tax=Tateyamaria sp. syn59 TaxID=2576942 RepID=UPI0011BD4B6A|nr:hypothetical protein [Tateyamaria sp. syn59]
MPLTPQQQSALNEIDQIIVVRRNVMARLKAARASTTDPQVLSDLKSARIAITRKNLVTVNARNRILRSASLGPTLTKLKSLTNDAKAADKAMANLDKVLKQATTLIQILGRLASILA